jgi:serine/threonine protein kinase
LDKGYKGFSCDIWSCGVLLYALLSGNVPFRAHNFEKLEELILSADYPPIKEISI